MSHTSELIRTLNLFRPASTPMHPIPTDPPVFDFEAHSAIYEAGRRLQSTYPFWPFMPIFVDNQDGGLIIAARKPLEGESDPRVLTTIQDLLNIQQSRPNIPFILHIKLQFGDRLEHSEPHLAPFNAITHWLDFLGKNQLKFSTWNHLEIELPNVELPSSFCTFRSGPLPLQHLLNLQHLDWSGHSSQLLHCWVPLIPSIISRLRTLRIRSDISIDDCACIMYLGRQLEKVNIRRICSSHIVESVMGAVILNVPSSGFTPVILPCLVTLKLEAIVDITALLQLFDFPALCVRQIAYTNPRPFSYYRITQ